jgi:hypothetical protein
LNPFHGSHHDFRVCARLGQQELEAVACEGAVSVELADLRARGAPARMHLGRAQLRPSDRGSTLMHVLRWFLDAATAG